MEIDKFALEQADKDIQEGLLGELKEKKIDKKTFLQRHSVWDEEYKERLNKII